MRINTNSVWVFIIYFLPHRVIIFFFLVVRTFRVPCNKCQMCSMVLLTVITCSTLGLPKVFILHPWNFVAFDQASLHFLYPWWLPFCSLLLRARLFQIPRINETMQYLSLCAWLMSLSIMSSSSSVLITVIGFPSFLTLNNTLLCVYIFFLFIHLLVGTCLFPFIGYCQ